MAKSDPNTLQVGRRILVSRIESNLDSLIPSTRRYLKHVCHVANGWVRQHDETKLVRPLLQLRPVSFPVEQPCAPKIREGTEGRSGKECGKKSNTKRGSECNQEQINITSRVAVGASEGKQTEPGPV